MGQRKETSTPPNCPKPLFSRTLRPGDGKLYFIDVYEGRTGAPYLSICENRKDKDGNFTRVRIYFTRGAVPQIRDAFDEAHRFLETLPKDVQAPAAATEKSSTE